MNFAKYSARKTTKNNNQSKKKQKAIPQRKASLKIITLRITDYRIIKVALVTHFRGDVRYGTLDMVSYLSKFDIVRSLRKWDKHDLYGS